MFYNIGPKSALSVPHSVSQSVSKRDYIIYYGATTLSISTLSIMTFSIMTLDLMTLGIMTLGITTLSIMTLDINIYL